MKKRLLALLLAGAMSVGLAACGNSGDEGSANTPAGGETTPVTDGTGEPSAEGKTVKVDVYKRQGIFSHGPPWSHFTTPMMM